MKILLAAAFVLCRLSVACAQSTATVRPDDPVYAFIDHLVASQMVSAIPHGQRPLSRGRIAAILATTVVQTTSEARGLLLVPDDSTWTARTLAHYRQLYPLADSLARAPHFNYFRTDISLLDSPSRTIPPDANGAIDVTVNPLAANRLGEPLGRRLTTNVSIEGELPIRSWLTAVATPRITDFRDGSTSVGGATRFDQLYLRALYRNVAVTVGRDYVFFGQGLTAGITNSLNPGAFDMVRVSSESPFVLPWLLHLLGPVNATAFVADLGGDQLFPHTHLINYKLSARPVNALELGVTVTDQQGGQGAPGGNFVDKIEDLFPILDATILHRTLIFSNKFSGIDARLRVPHARGLQLYMDGALDDFDLRRFKSSMTEDAGYIWGATYDCFIDCGALKMTGEYHVTGVRYYTHGIFKSGYTLHHQFIGDQLGPRGKAFYLSTTLDRVTSTRTRTLTIDLAHEIRSGDQYGVVSPTPNDADFHFVILGHHPAERRWRSVITAKLNEHSWMTTSLSAGLERVQHFDFQPGSWRTNSLVELREEVHPRAARRK